MVRNVRKNKNIFRGGEHSIIYRLKSKEATSSSGERAASRAEKKVRGLVEKKEKKAGKKYGEDSQQTVL